MPLPGHQTTDYRKRLSHRPLRHIGEARSYPDLPGSGHLCQIVADGEALESNETEDFRLDWLLKL